MQRAAMPRSPSRRPQQGFTLVEVLVALIVLSIGLLGLAAMQTKGLHYNHEAYLRSAATVLAQDMTDRMRANRSAVLKGDYSTQSAPSDPGYDCANSFPGGNTTCTPAQIAKADRYAWYTQAQSDLPGGCSGSGCKICLDGNPTDNTACDGSGSVYSIILSWKEKDPNAATGFATHEFVTRFQP
ncbi:MAG TPA: type IV pilus modification protein PilV [Gammaproteobacteria bacterium]|nr:type IV pilus modification protein PilV [Gammaproteobacteria bacterium]